MSILRNSISENNNVAEYQSDAEQTTLTEQTLTKTMAKNNLDLFGNKIIGYDKWADESYIKGYEEGCIVGYDDGYDEGYDDGVNVGARAAFELSIEDVEDLMDEIGEYDFDVSMLCHRLKELLITWQVQSQGIEKKDDEE